MTQILKRMEGHYSADVLNVKTIFVFISEKKTCKLKVMLLIFYHKIDETEYVFLPFELTE